MNHGNIPVSLWRGRDFLFLNPKRSIIMESQNIMELEALMPVEMDAGLVFLNALLYKCDSFLVSCISAFGHTATSCVTFQFLMTIIQLYPVL